MTLTRPFDPVTRHSYANSVAPDEMGINEPSHLDPHCLSFWFWFMANILVCNNGHIQKNEDEESTSGTRR